VEVGIEVTSLVGEVKLYVRFEDFSWFAEKKTIAEKLKKNLSIGTFSPESREVILEEIAW